MEAYTTTFHNKRFLVVQAHQESDWIVNMPSLLMESVKAGMPVDYIVVKHNDKWEGYAPEAGIISLVLNPDISAERAMNTFLFKLRIRIKDE